MKERTLDDFLALMAQIRPEMRGRVLEAYRLAGAPADWLAEGGRRYPVTGNVIEAGNRIKSPKPKAPTLAKLAANFASAIAGWVSAGFPVVSADQYAARLATCQACPFWDDKARMGAGKCGHPKCGCARWKGWLATERCPDGRWAALT